MPHQIRFLELNGAAAGCRVMVMETEQSNAVLHSHDFFELVFVRSGFILHSCNGHTKLLTAGDIIAIRPGDLHRYFGDRSAAIFNCLFTPEFLEASPQLTSLPGIRRVLRPDDTDGSGDCAYAHLPLGDRSEIQWYLSELLYEVRGRSDGFALKCEALLTALLTSCARGFCRNILPNGESRQYVGYVTQALDYVGLHFHESTLSVKEIASGVGISPDYLTRQFRQVTGMALIEYIRSFRFAKATELLHGDLPVSEISKSVGFTYLSHFSREFKAALGVTPTGFRENTAADRRH